MLKEPMIRWLMAPEAPELAVDHLLSRPNWMNDGACIGTPTEDFFPTSGADHQPAKAICARCTVSEDCLAYAIDRPDLHGVWGGTSERERQRMRRQARQTDLCSA